MTHGRLEHVPPKWTRFGDKGMLHAVLRGASPCRSRDFARSGRALALRCTVAAAGAATCFTVALATPANCRFELRGRPVMSGQCDADLRPDGSVTFQGRNGNGTKIVVSIVADSRTRANGILNVESRSATSFDDLGSLRNQGPCWTNALVKACVVRLGAR